MGNIIKTKIILPGSVDGGIYKLMELSIPVTVKYSLVRELSPEYFMKGKLVYVKDESFINLVDFSNMGIEINVIDGYLCIKNLNGGGRTVEVLFEFQ